MFSYMSLDQHRLILKSFFDSQFGCCPLIWMNHSRELNNKIDRIHEKGCHIVHRNKKSTVDELLDKDNSIKIHIKNLQVLVTDMFKVQNEKLTAIMSRVVPITEQNYILQNNCNFVSGHTDTVHYGSKSLSHLELKYRHI